MLADLADRYLAAQLAGDRRNALRVLVDEGLGRGFMVPALYLDVIQVAQHRIGELWQLNKVSVAQEHIATAISQLALAELYRVLPRAPSNGKRVVVACIAGELHDLGARMTSDFLEMSGFDVRYLGANLPTDSLLRMVREAPPDLVVLSLTMSFHVDALRDAVQKLRDQASDRLRLGVGGRVFEWMPSLRTQLQCDVYGRDACESAAAARKVLLGASV